ncbi:hypothetical protein [Paenibacillus campi]|uniref:hypothetical protein n=1 Tax=Paenibacillus campi TaxID=3106031 RepID=UPI002AFFC926|nr:hypothetical protein [Paenibacillus sp. SGZ-1009]
MNTERADGCYQRVGDRQSAYSCQYNEAAEVPHAASREDQESAEGHTDASDYNGK